MNIAKHFAAGIASVGLLGGLGCVSSGQGGERVEKVSKSDADSLDAEHSKFESNKDPEITAKTHFAAGQLAESQGALAAAIQQYRLAVRVDPHHQPSLYRLGVLYAQVRAYPEAIATWKTYVQETQEEATGYGNLGFCYELAGQKDEAEKAYQAGIAKDPKNGLCRVNYGLMLARMGRTEEARQQLGAVLSEAQVHYDLGSVYEQQGQRDQAKAEYQKALDLDPKLGEAKKRLGELESSK